MQAALFMALLAALIAATSFNARPAVSHPPAQTIHADDSGSGSATPPPADGLTGGKPPG